MDSRKKAVPLAQPSKLDDEQARLEDSVRDAQQRAADMEALGSSAREMGRDIAELNSSLDSGAIQALCASLDAARRNDVARRSAAALAALENQMKKATPALRALSLLVRAIPAAGDLPASVAMNLVRAIAHEFQRTHGAEGGTRRAVTSQAKVSQTRATWEAARQKMSVGAATAQTAQAHGISPGQVRRLRREARKRGTPWRDDDED
jgi:hypothetical protein